MNIIKEFLLEVRITQNESKQFGCDIATYHGELLHGVQPEYSHENDAIYAALHGLAIDNNFTGSLKAAEKWIDIVKPETRNTTVCTADCRAESASSRAIASDETNVQPHTAHLSQ